ncbi:VTT domain-containing protein [Fodinisporobacter ferrooxydans]|uniref:TVP38/TMEM64 family membrane protein n=1 Tax=Fodinisporobacter ferrooxydans TaxID=2901836 RepID=A0ABY4CJK0_9BACL|nr:VTT domain-containing protein [Alicyclobacillaceae bacterium MYW30-H2]
MSREKTSANRHSKDLAQKTMVIGTIVTVILFALYFYYVHTGKITPFIKSFQNLGIYGIALAILLLAILCVLPVPSEFLIVMNMEMYGIWFGTLYSWLGGIIGAVAALYLTRWLARPLVERMASKYLSQVNHWLHNRGSTGLLAVRFIPFIPYHLVNYIFGVMRIRLWPFVWTTALGILPFDLAMAGIFSGFRHGTLLWGAVGVAIFALLSVLGFVYRKRIF